MLDSTLADLCASLSLNNLACRRAGAIPAELGQLSALTVLSLNHNDLTGEQWCHKTSGLTPSVSH